MFDGSTDYHERINDPALDIDERTILVIRGSGPLGWPGSAEVVNMQPPDALLKRGITSLPTLGDGRQSGTADSPSIVHASPESVAGGGLSWLRTGDIGRVDEDGFLFIVDRKKDMIITGGYNVYPREIEEVLHRFEGVLEVAAIGAPDERLGERIVAFVVSADARAPVDAGALLAHCNECLARYKVPREVRLVDALPRNATGKVDRLRLRAIAADPNLVPTDQESRE